MCKPLSFWTANVNRTSVLLYPHSCVHIIKCHIILENSSHTGPYSYRGQANSVSGKGGKDDNSSLSYPFVCVPEQHFLSLKQWKQTWLQAQSTELNTHLATLHDRLKREASFHSIDFLICRYSVQRRLAESSSLAGGNSIICSGGRVHFRLKVIVLLNNVFAVLLILKRSFRLKIKIAWIMMEKVLCLRTTRGVE